MTLSHNDDVIITHNLSAFFKTRFFPEERLEKNIFSKHFLKQFCVLTFLMLCKMFYCNKINFKAVGEDNKVLCKRRRLTLRYIIMYRQSKISSKLKL